MTAAAPAPRSPLPAAVRVLGRPPAALRRRWRRSLQVRVVASTLLLSTVVVGLLGVLLLDQVSAGVLGAKQRAALGEAAAQFSADNDAAARTVAGDEAGVIDSIAQSVASRPNSADSFQLVILPAQPGVTGVAVPDTLQLSSVPFRLRSAVSAADSRLAYAYGTIRDGAGPPVPGLAVGAPLVFPSGVEYRVFLLFPLSHEEQTLSLVRRTVAITGAALVLLLAGIAALVTRQVVRPVRQAARTAERLAAGRLTERMTVRGTDDLARLADSFNRMARGLQAQIEQLEELSRLQQRFVADVSHELRTPLTTVRMAADVLHEARESFPPPVARAAELLQAELDRFETLLTDLLEISRYDAGAAVLEAEPVDLCELVRSVVDRTDALTEGRARVHLSMSPGACLAEVDPRRVERILRNLLVNAVEHGEGRPVEVRLAADREAVAVTVRDHGVGIDPQQLPRVFGRFWRADPSRTRRTGGTGLGLSIALEDTRLHGGWLQVWADRGAGSQFRMTLPRHAGAELTGSPLPLAPPPPSPAVGAALAPPAAGTVESARVSAASPPLALGVGDDARG